MCGIAGIYNLDRKPVIYSQVKKMSEALRHRGPDDEGEFIERNLGLAHRRLAIIDLSPTGRQPMSNEDGTILLVCNGEIYNYLELIPVLEAKGHRFYSKTDVEVIIHAYEEWGEECLDKFNGEFAFAIWDKIKNKLLLARDIFGTKPIYYYYKNGQFAFASEIKAFFHLESFKKKVCIEALSEYFTFQNIFTNKTLFNGVKLLPQGHVLTVTKAGLKERQYQDLVFQEERLPLKDYISKIEGAFERSIARHLISDVPVGSYLSGGMDSASIVALASRQVPRLMTFTGGFDLSSASGIELVFDERKDAERIAHHFHTTHYEMVIHSGDMSYIIPRLIWHLEDLRVGMSYQNFYIAQLASKFVKVVLAGAGGDEMFGGYPWRYDLVKDCKTINEFDKVYYRYWTRLVPDKEKKRFFSKQIWSKIKDLSTFEIYKSIVKKSNNGASLNRAFYFEAKTFLHGLLLVEDKISMANSLEVRLPFLDKELIELSTRILPDYKHNSGEGKFILRQAMRKFLPKTIIEKKKQGFSPPDASWYRGESMNYVKKIILDPRTLDRGYFNPKYIRNIVEEHISGRVNHRLLIWS
ncbi:MAG: asparagine synthase (glutamine-hydrolyzing), partial [Candidatus Omnitrophota bacterium]|nr:asparagine synthase (glutamine-hydrolyzing) [Candidatus Omnitrophota bacterium]